VRQVEIVDVDNATGQKVKHQHLRRSV